jgi:hypothetical protein
VATASFVRSSPSFLGWFAFSSGFGNQGFGGQSTQPMGGPGQYGGTFGPQAPPPRRSNTWLWILGGLGLAGLLVCGCCGGFMMFGMSQLSGALEEEVAGHPAIEQHIGDIQSTSLNLTATGEETNKRGGGKSVMVYDVKGSTGNGQLIAEQARQPQPGNMFDKIDLRLNNGDVISIK